MIRSFGVTHVVAECLDCKWRTEEYITGRALAIKHAKKNKHKVLVDVGITGFYDARIEQSS